MNAKYREYLDAAVRLPGAQIIFTDGKWCEMRCDDAHHSGGYLGMKPRIDESGMPFIRFRESSRWANIRVLVANGQRVGTYRDGAFISISSGLATTFAVGATAGNYSA